MCDSVRISEIVVVAVVVMSEPEMLSSFSFDDYSGLCEICSLVVDLVEPV